MPSNEEVQNFHTHDGIPCGRAACPFPKDARGFKPIRDPQEDELVQKLREQVKTIQDLESARAQASKDHTAVDVPSQVSSQPSNPMTRLDIIRRFCLELAHDHHAQGTVTSLIEDAKAIEEYMLREED